MSRLLPRERCSWVVLQASLETVPDARGRTDRALKSHQLGKPMPLPEPRALCQPTLTSSPSTSAHLQPVLAKPPRDTRDSCLILAPATSPTHLLLLEARY